MEFLVECWKVLLETLENAWKKSFGWFIFTLGFFTWLAYLFIWDPLAYLFGIMLEFWYVTVIIILVVWIKFADEISSLWKNTIRSRSEEGQEEVKGKGEEEVDLSYLTDIGPEDEEGEKKD
tara:strand:+ start:72 stop:434 length:363 start_codon:yes stop_codon:yes gene_type:complete